ncbi:MAG: type II toxin-antitoxin system Phd/YefM family antitoxin [Polyangiaceae bacterium]|jgi:antitoxin YefM
MSRTLPISEVKTHLPELVLSVEECEEEIIVTRKGRPAAVIINVDEYARLRETLDVLGDADLMKNIRRGRAYFRRGAKGVPMDRVFPKASAKSPKRK